MEANRTLIIVGLCLLCVSGVLTVGATSNHGDIYTWITDVADDDNYYGVDDAYIHFSDDVETVSTNDLYNDTNDAFNEGDSNDTAERTFYQVGDYVFKEPHEAVQKWNQGNHYEFNPGGNSRTIYPREVVERSELESSTHLKDAYVTFFSISPSTYVHYFETGPAESKTELRAGRTIDVKLIQAARTEEPTASASGRDVRKVVTPEASSINYTRVYTNKTHPDCRPQGPNAECLLANRSDADTEVQFNNLNLESSRSQEDALGRHQLRVQSKYWVKYNITTETRDFTCTPVPPSTNRGPKPPRSNWSESKDRVVPDAPGWNCDLSNWQYDSHPFKEDSVEIEDTKEITVKAPTTVQAIKANLPRGYEAYKFENLPRNGWSRITFNSNGTETLGIRSAYRFFSSRDKRFDNYCELDGEEQGSGYANSCYGTYGASDAAYTEDAKARPLRNHAIPRQETEDGFITGPDTKVSALLNIGSGRIPNVENHSTCDNGDNDNCNWRFVMYQNIDDYNSGNAVYEYSERFVLQRANQSNSARVYGLTGETSEPVTIRNTRDVHLATVGFDTLSEDELTGIHPRYKPPDGYVRVEITLQDNQTGEGIDLTSRSGEYIRISNGNNTYNVRTGTDGTVRINVKETSKPYRISYEHREWYNTPRGVQAYITAEDILRTPSDTLDQSEFVQLLLKMGLFAGIPLLLIVFTLRASGLSISVMELWRIIKDAFTP